MCICASQRNAWCLMAWLIMYPSHSRGGQRGRKKSLDHKVKSHGEFTDVICLACIFPAFMSWRGVMHCVQTLLTLFRLTMVTITTTICISPLSPNIQCIKVKRRILVYEGTFFKGFPRNTFLALIFYSFHQHKLERRERGLCPYSHIKSIYP